MAARAGMERGDYHFSHCTDLETMMCEGTGRTHPKVYAYDDGTLVPRRSNFEMPEDHWEQLGPGYFRDPARDQHVRICDFICPAAISMRYDFIAPYFSLIQQGERNYIRLNPDRGEPLKASYFTFSPADREFVQQRLLARKIARVVVLPGRLTAALGDYAVDRVDPTIYHHNRDRSVRYGLIAEVQCDPAELAQEVAPERVLLTRGRVRTFREAEIPGWVIRLTPPEPARALPPAVLLAPPPRDPAPVIAGPAAPPPAPAPVIAGPAAPAQAEAAAPGCAVCFEPMEGERREKVLVPCGHTFCAVCVDQIMRSTGLCPTCRGQIQTAIVLHKQAF